MTQLEIAGHRVGRVGYGTMQLTGPLAMGEPADAETAKAALRRAVDGGVRLVDTSAYYGPEVANRLLAETLSPFPADLLVATKVGARRTADGGFAADATPDAVRAAVHANLAQLGVSELALVHARFMPDSDVPFEETVGALADLRQEGLVAHVGVSNVDTELLHRAQEVVEVASVQNQLALGAAIDREVLKETARASIPFLAFRPLGNGALARPGSPVTAVAARIGAAPATVALAWALAQGDHVAVIPGTATPAHVDDALAAAHLELDDATLAELETLAGP